MGGVARLAATLVDGEQHGEAALAGVVDLPAQPAQIDQEPSAIRLV